MAIGEPRIEGDMVVVGGGEDTRAGELKKVKESLEGIENANAELSRTNEQLLARLGRADQRLQTYTDELVKGRRQEPEVPPEPQPMNIPDGFDRDELSPEGEMILSLVGQEFGNLRQLLEHKEQSVQRGVDGQISRRMELAEIQRQHPDHFPTIGKLAMGLCAQDPKLGTRQAWEEAVKLSGVDLEVAPGGVTNEEPGSEKLKKEAIAVAGEKPGGEGGSEELTPEQEFHEKFVELGIEGKQKGL